MIPRVPTYFVGVRAHGNAECPCESKISQLEVVVLIDEKVLGFEVPVQDSVGMAI